MKAIRVLVALIATLVCPWHPKWRACGVLTGPAARARKEPLWP
jgi:hypothetical protein